MRKAFILQVVLFASKMIRLIKKEQTNEETPFSSSVNSILLLVLIISSIFSLTLDVLFYIYCFDAILKTKMTQVLFG